MTFGALISSAPSRQHRPLTEEFGEQAVQLLHGRRAQGGTAAPIGRDLEVQRLEPTQLRVRVASLEACLAIDRQ